MYDWGGIVVRFLVGPRDFPLLQSVLTVKGSQTSSYWMGTGGPFSARHSGRSVKLIAHLHLVPTLRTSGATPPLPHMALSLKILILSCHPCPRLWSIFLLWISSSKFVCRFLSLHSRGVTCSSHSISYQLKTAVPTSIDVPDKHAIGLKKLNAYPPTSFCHFWRGVSWTLKNRSARQLALL